MAILKHIKSRNANYSDAIDYLLFQHDESTGKKKAFEQALREEKMKTETIDVTLPGQRIPEGHRHPNTKTLEEVENIFVGMGYEIGRAHV